MSKLILKSKKTMETIEEERSKGGRTDYFKPKPNPKGIFKVFICPQKDEDTPIVQKALVFEVFSSSGKVAGPVTSPANFEEKDAFSKIGWALKDKYEGHKNPKVKEFFKDFLPKQKTFLFVIDPTDTEAGIQMWQAPKAVVDFVLNEIETNEGEASFAHPESGRLLVVKKTGAKLQTKYQCAWAKDDCNLDGIDEDKLIELLPNIPTVLGTIFKKPTKDEIEEYKEYLDTKAEKLGISINWKNTKDSNLEVDDDADPDFGDDDDVDADEVEEKSSKKSAPAKGKSKPAKDEDDDDLDLDDDDAVDADDDEFEEKKTSSKNKKTETKNTGKKPAKEEDEDLDFDDDEVEEKTSKKSSGKPTSKDAGKKKKVVDDEDDDLDFDDE